MEPLGKFIDDDCIECGAEKTLSFSCWPVGSPEQCNKTLVEYPHGSNGVCHIEALAFKRFLS